MSNNFIGEVLGLSIFDPDYKTEDPDMNRFFEEVRNTVDKIIGEYAVDGRGIDEMSQEEKEELRQRLIGIKLTLTPDGEIIHE